MHGWLEYNDQLIDLGRDVNFFFGGGGSGLNGNIGLGGTNSVSGGGGGGGFGGGTDTGWNMPSDAFYEYGHMYYNLATHQQRYLNPHTNDLGTTLVTESLPDGWDIANFTLGAIGLEMGSLEFGWYHSSKISQSSSAYKIQQSLRDSGIRVHSGAIKRGIPKMLKGIGQTVGWVGVAVTVYQSVEDGNFTWGDGVKVTIGIVTTITPLGWVYGAIDLGVMVFNNGVSLTDMFGNKIDKW